jgi:hypothetical protein
MALLGGWLMTCDQHFGSRFTLGVVIVLAKRLQATTADSPGSFVRHPISDVTYVRA